MCGSVFLNGSACAGSVASGCWFSGHIFKPAFISKADAVILDAPECHLACLMPPSWHLGDDLGLSGAPWRAEGAAEQISWRPESDFY